MKKCRSRQFSISDPNQFSKSIERLKKKGTLHPALHTAAHDLFKVQVTNLRGAEYYLPEWDNWDTTAKELGLIEQERGYDVLLLEPYYAAIVKEHFESGKSKLPLQKYALLTFLDLYHFPLRGREQAEALYRKLPFLSRICPWGEIDDIS